MSVLPRLRGRHQQETESCGAEERIQPLTARHGLSTTFWHQALAIVVPIALLAVWEVGARLGGIDTRFFPAPTSVMESFVRLVGTGELLANLKVTAWRIFFGFFAGAIPGVVLGLVLGLVPWLRSALSHVIAAIFPIPKSALLPLFLLMFGVGETSKIVLLSTGVFFPVLLNTMAGALGVPQIYRDVGHNYGARGLRFYGTVVLPWALPSIFAGLRIGVNIALVLIVIAEIAGANSGIGFLIWRAWLTFDIELLYVGLVVIALLGITLTIILERLQKLLVPWKL